ncbi:aldo/keto reductase [Falsiroseomonas stagni]|uniref:Aldo/keto reductase n=1 Tax=Falsiroseomonas stagni DSM 19981 TaxID=1123062 RepID=A0A1I4AAL2_9PROT|nr:aldo/keto reductase [Falsiroseomonas stagni]SFK53438.1 Aldo/keto reductase [Falsiroseomonas stagni DSM 19981]
MKQVTFAHGTAVPALGQGTWYMGERGSDRRAEAAALRLGLDLGMTVIDTAEMYAEGGAEQVVAEAIAGRRDECFLVSKVYPHNAGARTLPLALEASLKRLRVERIDLYLLHWRGGVPLAETVAAMEKAVAAGKIARWGVSNLDVDDLEELGRDLPDCATDQVLWNLGARGVEFDLLPFCGARGMPVMAYSPIGQGGALLRHPALRAIGARHGATPAQVALAFVLARPGVIAIPKAADPDHVRQNAAARELVLTPAELAELDAAFPPPRRKQALAML